MTRRRSVLLASYVVVAAADIVLSGSQTCAARRTRGVTKPLLMPLLAAAFCEAPAGPRHLSTLLAQAFSWGGDVALLGKGNASFVVGTTSFGIAHGAYTAGFVRERDATRDLTSLPSVRVLATVGSLTAPVIALRAGRKARMLGVAVAAYSGLLTLMSASAQRVAGSPRQRWLTSTGAVLFLASDTLLGVRTFVVADPPAWLRRLVMTTYTTAQLLLSEGAAG